MKKILTIALLLIAINAQGQGLPVAANATLASLFPDENLRRVVAKSIEESAISASPMDWEARQGNPNMTGQRLSEALARVERVDGSNRGIRNTEGIQYLVELTYLNLSFNQLTGIDLSGNRRLSTLKVNNNQLTNLDLTNNAGLDTLEANNNLLTLVVLPEIKMVLRMGGGAGLSSIQLSNNQLESLNIGLHSEELTYLYVNNNKLINLNIGYSRYLAYLNISYNPIFQLDLSFSPHLRQLWFEGTLLTKENIIGLPERTELNPALP